MKDEEVDRSEVAGWSTLAQEVWKVGRGSDGELRTL